jgi:predicted DNA-binding mobile mystery protein A
MLPQARADARRQLDKRLTPFRNLSARPPKGWIKAIRESLAMSTRQFAKRLGISQPAATELENNESSGAITLGSLERAARALDCELVYALVPRKSLEALATERAEKVARSQLQSTSHTMSLEAQSVDPADEYEQVKQLARRLLEQPRSKLWD